MQPDPADRSSDPFPPGPRRHRRPGAGPVLSPGLVVLRVAIIAVSLAIGIVLLSRGDLVLGVLLVAFAALRVGMFLTVRRRRRQWRDARGAAGR